MSEPSGPASRPERPDTVQVLTGGEGRRGRPMLVPAAVVAVAAAIIGVGAGLLWRLVAPHVVVVKVDRGFLYAEAQPEQAVAADGWFAFLGVAAGLLAATVAWLGLRRRRGVVVLVALVLGSLVGAWLGWWLGIRLELSDFDALAASVPVGTRLDAPLSLRITDLDRAQWWPPKATGVVVAQALAAAVAYTTLAGFASDPDLSVDPPEPAELPEPGPWPAVRPTYETVQGDQAPPTAPQPVPPRPQPGLSSGPDGPSGPPDSPARP